METIDRQLAAACPDQRKRLEKFARSGKARHLTRVHFERCSSCSDVLDALTLAPTAKPAALVGDPADDALLTAITVIGGTICIALMLILFIRLTTFPFPERRDHLPFVSGMIGLILLDLRVTIRWTNARLARYAKTAPD